MTKYNFLQFDGKFDLILHFTFITLIQLTPFFIIAVLNPSILLDRTINENKEKNVWKKKSVHKVLTKSVHKTQYNFP